LIEIRKLIKSFGNVEAVRGLDLTIDKGVLFGFLGPNGAGKTTTIRMMIGLLRPDAGTITIGGHDVEADSIAVRRIVGYIPDRPYLYPKLTGRETLAFIGELYSIPPAEVPDRIDQLLDYFELTHRADSLVEGYSHGMKQRLVFAAALLHRPRILIVDEPMVGLDPRYAKQIKVLLRSLCQRGMTVFMSTHTLEVAEEMCDRIGIINEGELVAEGTLGELTAAAGEEGGRLEQIFLKLTGGHGIRDIIDWPEGDEGNGCRDDLS